MHSHSQDHHVQPPWQRRPSHILYFVSECVSAVALISLMSGGLLAVKGADDLFTLLGHPNTNLWLELFKSLALIVGSIAVAIGAGQIHGRVRLVRKFAWKRRAVRNAQAVNPQQAGKAFSVVFHEDIGRRSFAGNGEVIFSPASLQINNKPTQTTIFQIMQLLPAVLHMYFIASPQTSHTTHPYISLNTDKGNDTYSYPYSAIKTINARYKTVDITTNTDDLHHICFSVTAKDGERLYRELARYFPEIGREYERWLV